MLIIALGVSGGLILLSFSAIEINNSIIDHKAKRLIKSYCKNHELEILELNYLPGHYGLYYRKDAETYYSGFSLESGKIKWIRQDPLKSIKRRTARRKSVTTHRSSHQLLENQKSLAN